MIKIKNVLIFQWTGNGINKIMRKIFILVKILVFSILLGVIAYQQYRYKWLENSWWRLEKERDSLCYLDYLRRNEHLPEYYLLSKDSILKLLPRPTSDKIWIFAGKKKELDSYNWPARQLRTGLSGFGC